MKIREKKQSAGKKQGDLLGLLPSIFLYQVFCIWFPPSTGVLLKVDEATENVKIISDYSLVLFYLKGLLLQY